jgi:putative endonuclease
MSVNRQVRGREGENRTATYLLSCGYTIIVRNWRTRYGEIDIIAEKADTLAFVEVKTLPSGVLQTLEHVLGSIKQQRIIETAKCFLFRHRQYNDSYIRFDVAVIDMPNFPPVYYIENAFSERV